MVVNGVIAIVIAYLLGSLTFAYIITRLVTGKDIRQLGGGNAGARNVYREVGLGAAIPVAILDIGKGAAAVVLASRLLDVPLVEPNLFVLLAGLAAVAGHMWSIYLKFSGGNGLAATIGVLSLVMGRELLIILGLMLLLTVITRNPVFSLNTSLLSLPVSAWFLEKSGLSVAFALVLLAILVLNFLPTARVALARAGSRGNLLTELLRRNKTKPEAN